MKSGKKDKSKPKSPAVADDREIVALALNEQGFLLQHKIEDVLQSKSPSGKASHNWYIEATELPVSIPSEFETRIDIVLRLGPQLGRPWRVVVECKRSSRDFKRWVFFGQTARNRGPVPNNYYVGLADLAGSWNGRGDPLMNHRVEVQTASPNCPVYEYGVEARLNRPGSGQKASATEAIEKAFQQVTLGQAALAVRLWKAHELTFRLLPVAVTTADLMSADFSTEKVSLDRGIIDPNHLKLEPKRWLAVNYHVNDSIFQLPGMPTNRSKDLAADLAARQVRTIFVVQAEHIQAFLAWLETHFQCSQ